MTRSRTLSALATIALLVGLLATAAVQAPAASAGHPDRISGVDRYETAAKVSASRFTAGVPVAYVVTGAKFPDALAAGVAAGVEQGPVLLTQPNALPPATSAELDRLRPDEIVVVGGTGSVSDGVLAQLRAKTSGEVTRVQGPDRFATAAAVAAHAFTAPTTAYVASGETFPDALAGVPAAVRKSAPLLLVNKDRLPEPTGQYIAANRIRDIVILGGPGTVSPAVEDQLRSLAGSVVRVAGADRFATAAAVSERGFPSGAPVAYLATGLAAADALAAGPVAALAGGPVLLVRGNCIPPAVEAEIARLGSPDLVILGGDRAVGMAVEDETRCPSGANQPGSPTVGATPTTATWDDDGPDPHIVRFGHEWYAYTTGTTWGNNIAVLVSDRPDGGWHTTTIGQTWGSTALASSTIPGWQVPDSQWAPAVYRFAGRYVMFYAAQARTTMEWCLSVAVADAPEGPFRDQTAATGPIVCQDHLGGTIDPHPFVDADGTPWLHFKNNDGLPGRTYGVDAVSSVWAVRLSVDGTRPVGGHHHVMAKDTTRYPWQTTVDNPQMVIRGGVHYLFHTGGDYVDNDTYATGYAVCAGPIGPCPESHQILTSYGNVAGPGGGTVARGADGRWWISYHAWTKGCYDYEACGGKRKLYVAPLTF